MLIELMTSYNNYSIHVLYLILTLILNLDYRPGEAFCLRLDHIYLLVVYPRCLEKDLSRILLANQIFVRFPCQFLDITVDFNWDFYRQIVFLLRFLSRAVGFINRYLVMTSGRNSLFLITNGVFIIWRKASPLCQDSVKTFVKMYICVYMRGGPALLGRILLLRSCLGGLEILLASQSSIQTTKFVLASIFLDNFSFYKFCLFMCRL